jgi:expansin (peptidoglycan-binding protein)
VCYDIAPAPLERGAGDPVPEKEKTLSRSLRPLLVSLALMAALGAGGARSAQPSNTIYLPRVVGVPANLGEQRTGRATYYEATGDGNCMFGPSPHDLMVAAISHEDYSVPGHAAYCGAYVEVTGELGSVVVRIVDKCPDAACTRGHLDLSPQAFARIAPIVKGIVPITWRVVSPNLGRAMAYHIKPGSNQWWTAIQARYHRNPIVKMEFRNAAGQWAAMERQDYNYFVGENMGPGPYTLRVTDRYGNGVTDSDIVLAEDVETPGNGQFPFGP